MTIIEEQFPHALRTMPSYRDAYRVWRKAVESFKAVQGMRPALEHVEEHRWEARFAANEDAFSAVVSELETVDV